MPTQTTDIVFSGPIGINYAGPGKTWTIANGVFVGGSGTGVYSAFNGSKLVNKGDVVGASYGVDFAFQKNGTVVNHAGASTVGLLGIYFGVTGSKNMTVINDGTIVGTGGGIGILAADVSNFELTNTGKIFGGGIGVEAAGGSVGATGPTIDNSGKIGAPAIAILTAMIPGLTTTIHNRHGGTITSDLYAIEATGKLSLDNHGKIKGDILAAGSDTHDKVVNAGQIKGEVYLGDGNDTYKNAGGTAGKVHGGDGNDTLIAGPHTDKFVFDTTLNAATNVDRVKHFDPGTDKLILDQTFFPALSGPGTLASAEFHKGTGAHDTDDRIIYSGGSGALYYDPDGLGGVAKVEFAKLDKHLHLHASDFIVIA